VSQTFSQFKTHFYERVTDFSVFDCEDFNLLKVVLDGLKVEYLKKGILNETIFKTSFVDKLKLQARRLKFRKAATTSRLKIQHEMGNLDKPFLLFDNARVAEDASGKKVSFYFHRIQQYLGSEKCTTIYQSQTVLKEGPVVLDLLLGTLFVKPTKDEKIFISNLKKTYHKIVGLNVFSEDELTNIRVAINKFYDEHRFWNRFLKRSKTKFVLFDQHYSREGFILALKRKKIKVIELQHGLIAPEDIFYVFPQSVIDIASKAMFPDLIFTFGSYWSEVLKKGFEFMPEQIEVLGMYQENNTFVSEEKQLKTDRFLNGCDFVLVTTQTFLHPYFAEYVEWLSGDMISKGSKIKIIVKNHPSEKIDDYESLQTLGNVMIHNVNTEYLLSRCKWHISCYSTTLYDATKYNCMNFSLLIEPCRDYIDTFIKEGISELINKKQNPVFLETTGATLSFDKKTLYENFDEHKDKLKWL